LNVLQTNRLPRDGKAVPFVSDFFDFSIYLDADETLLRRWYVERFMRLRETAFRDPQSYFRRYATIPAEEALSVADDLWTNIN
ncbi:type I pantothenate kinase, partial [Mycobacterium tuberculosis]|nr:type I pantothenate kinase [Mycobacterium tuberculosis]